MLSLYYFFPIGTTSHIVGPVWKGGMYNEHKQLASCYWSSLVLMKEKDCKTAAFPLISTGVYGYPKDQAIQIAVNTIQAFLCDHAMTVYLVFFDERTYQIGKTLFIDFWQKE